MSEAVVTFEEAKAALKTFREWEGKASDIDGMWFVLKSDRERTRPTGGVVDWGRCEVCGFYACDCPDLEREV